MNNYNKKVLEHFCFCLLTYSPYVVSCRRVVVLVVSSELDVATAKAHRNQVVIFL